MGATSSGFRPSCGRRESSRLDVPRSAALGSGDSAGVGKQSLGTGTSGAPAGEDIPLFPLGAIIFPGGLLPLRVFEPRYLELVKRCMREGTGFGIVPIKAGREALASRDDILPDVFPAGTYVRVTDFDQLEDGLLGIECQGEWKFRLRGDPFERERILWSAVSRLSDEAAVAVPPEATGMVDLLRQVSAVPQFENRLPAIDYGDARQVGWRLAELLPLAAEIKQELLLLDDPRERLALLSDLVTAMRSRQAR